MYKLHHKPILFFSSRSLRPRWLHHRPPVTQTITTAAARPVSLWLTSRRTRLPRRRWHTDLLDPDSPLLTWPSDPSDRQHLPVKLLCASLLLLETNDLSQPSFLSNCLAFSSDTCAHLLTGVETESMEWVQACSLMLAVRFWVYSGSMWEKSFLLYDFSSFPLTLALRISLPLSNQQSLDTKHAPSLFLLYQINTDSHFYVLFELK